MVSSTVAVPEGPGAHLPQTSGPDLGWVMLGIVVCVLGVVAVCWSKLHRR
jgi:hypothetical protein